MKKTTEYDFRNDLHGDMGSSPAGVYVCFKNGNTINLSWKLIKDLTKFINKKNE